MALLSSYHTTHRPLLAIKGTGIINHRNFATLLFKNDRVNNGSHAVLSRQHMKLHAQGDKDEDLQLVRTEDVGDETVLFVFGPEAEALAAASSKEEKQSDQSPEPDSDSSSSDSDSDSPPTRGLSDSSPASGSSEQQTGNQSPRIEEQSRSTSPPNEPGAASTSASTPDTGDSEGNQGNLPSQYDADALRGMKVNELRDVCKDHNLRGYSKLKKEELVSLITDELSEK